MSDIVKMYPKNAGQNPDNVLEQAVGSYSKVLILGWDKDGKFDPRASTNMSLAETVLLSVKATNFLSQWDEFTEDEDDGD